MDFTFTRNFQVHLHWDWDEILPWYYVMILGVTYSFYFGPYLNLLKDHIWYKIMKNFNSLGCLVLEISAFQYEACHGFRAGASVHKLFVGGVKKWMHVDVCVWVCVYTWVYLGFSNDIVFFIL